MDVEKNENSIPAYVDDYSCREMNRPSLDAALTYLEEVGFEVVVVHSIDRLARDPYIRQTLEMEFFRRSAKVEFALGNYDDSPEGEVRKDMDATFAKWENAKRVEPCNRGKRGKAEKAGRPLAATQNERGEYFESASHFQNTPLVSNKVYTLAAGRRMAIFWMQKGLAGFQFIRNRPKSFA